jgi:hypothetical protein
MSILLLPDRGPSANLDPSASTRLVVHVFLYSRYNKEITVFSSIIDRDGDIRVHLSGNGCSFKAPNEVLNCLSAWSCLKFVINSDEDRLSGKEHAQNSKVVTMFAQMEDGAVFEALYISSEDHRDDELDVTKVPELYETRQRRKYYQSPRYVDDEEGDYANFVVGDEDPDPENIL